VKGRTRPCKPAPSGGRAGARTSRSYGSGDDLLPRYAWYTHNSRDRTPRLVYVTDKGQAPEDYSRRVLRPMPDCAGRAGESILSTLPDRSGGMDNKNEMGALVTRTERLIGGLISALLATAEVAAEKVELAARVAQMQQRMTPFAAVLESVRAAKEALFAKLETARWPASERRGTR
jgi:hypothetical protein